MPTYFNAGTTAVATRTVVQLGRYTNLRARAYEIRPATLEEFRDLIEAAIGS